MKTKNFSETITACYLKVGRFRQLMEFKVGRFRQLMEFMKECEYSKGHLHIII